jgi:hypothetical protein
MTGVMHRLRWLAVGALMLALATPLGLRAQGNPQPELFKFNTGQGITPIFEGWSHNPDGSFEMWFGYYNKNYVEVLVLPVGPANTLAPGLSDRGQPTVFGTRIKRKQFHVTVPSDWARRELIWSVTVRGVTEKAVAWLQPEWEIDPVYAGKFRDAESLKNTPPVLTVDVPTSIGVADSLKLTATVVDDGLPKTAAQQGMGGGARSNDPPTLKALPDQPEIPVNVPSVAPRGRGAGGGGGGGGAAAAGPRLSVNWIVWRGPADVKFAAATTPIKDQKEPATTTASFTMPGTYVLRATANDGELTVQKYVTVTVK